jgi:mono/diheme cytochrome c family protein
LTRALFTLLLLLPACDRGPFTHSLTLGGRPYSAAQLNRGHTLYQQGCRACHGDLGDGHGVSAPGLWPPPRDLTLGLYKFGRVPAPGLPPDAELVRILRGGLGGTAMLRWQLADEDIDPLLSYIKSLSTRWQTELPGEAVVAGPDPYGGASPERQREIVARGEALYHGKALCSTCHPVYVTRARLFEITSANGAPVTTYTPETYGSRVKDTEQCWRWQGLGDARHCEEPVRTIPPDFLRDSLRAVRTEDGQQLPDLFVTLAAGINGAGMPAWKGVFPDDELWAVAWYVRSLVELRGTPAAEALRLRLHAEDNIDWHAPVDR